jgi:hypothetical protein
MADQEFYIGWQPAAPRGAARHMCKVVIALVMLITGAAIVLSLRQRKFSAGKFEYGKPTEVKGIYRQFPVPSLKVITGRDASGNNSFITLPLVGYGKSGAEGVIAFLEQERKTTLDQKEVTLRGTLIYNGEKTFLQIDQNDSPLIHLGNPQPKEGLPQAKELGDVELEGEILDPKCYFGVMKPGSGKPHRDCAIRCIAGGISPVFYVQSEQGEADYYLLLDEQGNKLNTDVKNFVAEPVSLQARAVQYDDWVILYVKKKSIRRTGKLSWFKSTPIACKPAR